MDWTKSPTLGGPKPRPDFAAGISRSAFTEEELAKLKNHMSFERPTLMADDMYFPFPVCEAKCGGQGINRADQQKIPILCSFCDPSPAHVDLLAVCFPLSICILVPYVMVFCGLVAELDAFVSEEAICNLIGSDTKGHELHVRSLFWLLVPVAPLCLDQRALRLRWTRPGWQSFWGECLGLWPQSRKDLRP